MRLLIQQVEVIDKEAPQSGQVVDILVENGSIAKIGQQLDVEADTVWAANGCSASAGWVDVGAYANDPGFEYKEDLETLGQAAAKGGFTTVLTASNTAPTIQSKAEVLYIKNNTQHQTVDFYPLGAVTKACEGKEIAELFDMYRAGAVGFSDGYHAIQHSGVLLRALEYAKAFDGWVANQPLDGQIASGGYAHEGIQSTLVGMKGIPALAEAMMVKRDLYLLEYTESKLYLANISTRESVELIRKAKSEGLQVIASVNPMSLYFTDEVLFDFDTNYRVSPPIRSAEHRDALIEGLKDGTIDFITSNHRPQDTESKRLEFMYADDGVIMLETAFSVTYQALKDHLDVATIVEKWTKRQRECFQLPTARIAEGERADLTVFNLNEEWAYHETDILSKSKNTPFKNTYLKGKVFGIVNNDKCIKLD